MTRTRRTRFESKDAARSFVWERLERERAARFPFPPQGRIPNFAGAREAAERLLAEPPFDRARTLKVNPDSPQRPLRELLLRRGSVILMPTPRLRAGFLRLDPAKLDPAELGRAASLGGADRLAERVPLDAIPRIDAIVSGSVAVTREGGRCGKGEGYADLEHAILCELGQDPVPIGTTVHPLQLLDAFPRAPHDLPISVIATPDSTIQTGQAPDRTRLDWSLLTNAQLEAMPILADLRSKVAST